MAMPDKLTAHRGLATWGEKLVPLDAFRQAAAAEGRTLPPKERQAAVRAYLAAPPDPTPVEGPYSRIAVFGGVYSNHLALAGVLEEAARRGAEAIYCLGDLGAFGPNPEKVRPLLAQGGVLAIQGNYEESLASGREDCNCGYTDPRDNHFAEISYRYTAENCSPGFKAWMGTLPRRRRVRVGERELLLVHGSPRRVNEFLFHSTSPVPFLEVLLDQNHCDGILCTHTGLHWHRRLPSGRDVINVGVIGRPANDGNTHVWFAMLEAREAPEDRLGVELLPLPYDHLGLAAEMRRERLPEEFVETVLTGWWTTCLEILPARERTASRF
ncbi:MAG TPA: metallophosphoesterase family protein [Thermoanaerobaculia bacterium]|nr:metallophosphoesterase family protein [Thermoanaerobaculia bacterium]